MAKVRKPTWLVNSWAYDKARKIVQGTIDSPDKLRTLASKASLLAEDNLASLHEVASSLKTSLRLIRCYAKGEYRDISMQSLALLVTSLIYLVMPVDAVPDFIAIFGFTDDAALLLWTLRSIMDDLERFTIWEANREPHSTNF